MKIIYFGAIDKNFSNNQIFWRGFVKNGVKIVDVVIDTPIKPLNFSEDAGLKPVIKRIWAKLSVFPLVVKRWSEMKGADALFVGYPGHFDIPFAYIIAKMLRIPLIFYPVLILSVTFRDDIKLFKSSSWKLKILTIFEKLIYRLCDVVIADGPYQREVFQNEFGVPSQKLHYVYAGANDKLYPYSPTKNQRSHFNVVYYGMYTPLHGVEYVIKAAKLLSRNPHIKFLMVGNGKIFTKMYQLAINLQVKNIRFYPNVREPQAKPLLKQATVFLGLFADSPSVKRQIANKVFQGMAMGKAVITADAPIVRTILKHGKNVYLIPAADPPALAKSILKLYKDPTLTYNIGREARRTFEQEFTPQIVTAKIIDIIETYNMNKSHIKGHLTQKAL